MGIANGIGTLHGEDTTHPHSGKTVAIATLMSLFRALGDR